MECYYPQQVASPIYGKRLGDDQQENQMENYEEMVIMEDEDGNETCEFLSDVLEEEKAE